MRRVSGLVLPFIVIVLSAASAQEQARRPRLAPVRTSCPVRVGAVRLTTDPDGQPSVSYDVTNDSEADLLLLETVVLVYNADGVRRAADAVDTAPRELPLAVGATLPVAHVVADLRDDDFVRVAVADAGTAHDGCGRAQAERTSDAEFDPPKVLVSNPEGSPITLGTTKLLETASGEPLEVAFVVVNHSEGTAVDTVATLLFQYSASRGATIRVQSLGANRSPLLPGGSKVEYVRFTPPADMCDGCSWKVVLVPVEVIAGGRKWSLGDAVAEGRKTLAAAAAGRLVEPPK